MIKILEKFYGERILLVCEKTIEYSGHATIKLISDCRVTKTECSVLPSRNCFSEPRTIFIMLPEDFDAAEVEIAKEIEFL